MTDKIDGDSIVMWQNESEEGDGAIVFQPSEHCIQMQQGDDIVSVAREHIAEFVKALRRAAEIEI